ncbi:hypothetical protein LTR10_020656 [Elasticomyces elasticus]|uniref:Translocation protein SEC62 n=1 Tax=Exophiala sideris TaxID=1016849 RepID=A0ABR0J806_9EURO|nr:hypothetical protein LTR10_020656 [Elasticomyces elasticus]KAK5030006.1 hypothetical protein LTS07_005730 [Exophiala sideris]KAK5031553.1 hypothetical protein LTR13_007542 [Exophiala sideris]KAK5058230.1 hypothetical protein LTR69_006634 [Exophiala sideris]KAK5180160.1 hypothetical protein LTR44_007285 [Eurotiomycetes sp. CCFEE 6388]
MTTDPNWPPQWLTVTIVVLYYVFYPVYLVLKVLWYIILLLSAPFIYIGRATFNLSLIPWRIFARFEPIWYFVGTAIVLGVLLGLILHFAMRAFVVVLNLDHKPEQQPIPAKGHDAVSYRKAREAKKQKQVDEQQRLTTQAQLIASQPLIQEAVREARKMPLSGAPVSPISPNVSSANRPGLLQQTILEHSDEDDDSSVF